MPRLRPLGALLLALALPAAAHAAPVPSLPRTCALPGIDDRCESWSIAFDAQPDATTLSSESDTGLALSPDGKSAYVTVQHRIGGQYGVTRWVVLALDAATGEQRWDARFTGVHGFDRPGAVAVSPDGRRVLVTGTTYVADFDSIMLTIAYDAATGQELWRRTLDGPGETENGRAMVMSPKGDEVYIAASSETAPGATSDMDWAITAYDARDGDHLWTRRWAGAGTGEVDYPVSIGVHPSGRLVYAAGQAAGTVSEWDIDTAAIAVRAAGPGKKGAIAWAQRWDARGRGENDEGAGLAVDPGGELVYVVGRSKGTGAAGTDYDAATLALDARTGERAWSVLAPGPVDGYTAAQAVAAAPGRVFVTMQSTGSGALEFDWRTVAYDTTGAQLWSQTFATPDFDGEYPADVTATANGVWVTGKSFNGHTNPLGRNGDIQGIADHVTVAYDPASGEPRWVARNNGTGYDHDSASAVAAAGGRVVTTGHLRYKGDLSGLQQGDPNGRENFTDVSVTAYEDERASVHKSTRTRRACVPSRRAHSTRGPRPAGSVPRLGLCRR